MLIIATYADVAGRVAAYLEELGVGYDETGGGALKVDCGTTAVYIRVREGGERRIVVLLAPVLVEVDPQPEQLVQLLTANAELPFGKFSWHADERTISVEWELLGDFRVSTRSRGAAAPGEPPVIPAEGREPALLIASR